MPHTTAYQAKGRNADNASYGAALEVWHQFEYNNAAEVAAEEFICQVYVAYIKRVLSCIRAGAKSIAILFLTLGAAVSCYPILSPRRLHPLVGHRRARAGRK